MSDEEEVDNCDEDYHYSDGEDCDVQIERVAVTPPSCAANKRHLSDISPENPDHFKSCYINTDGRAVMLNYR